MLDLRKWLSALVPHRTQRISDEVAVALANTYDTIREARRMYATVADEDARRATERYRQRHYRKTGRGRDV